jgi:hypothetical protein
MAKKPVIDSEDDDLVDKARATLHEFFDNHGKRTSIDVATARIASSVYSTHAKIKQSRGAADALSFMIARELASDRVQLEQFLTAAMPSAPIVRALPASPKKES